MNIEEIFQMAIEQFFFSLPLWVAVVLITLFSLVTFLGAVVYFGTSIKEVNDEWFTNNQ
jgi:hypothetical protein